MGKTNSIVVRALSALAACAGIMGCQREPPGCLIGDEACLRGDHDSVDGDPEADPCSPDAGAARFALLQEDLVNTCGGCHKQNGKADTPFLRAPDYYASISSWPDIVVRDPAQSRLLTHPRSGGGHGGTNLDADGVDPTLLPRVQAWLNVEALGLACRPPRAGRSTTPRAPIDGFNTVYLDELSADLAGMAITFNVDGVGKKGLTLSEIEVHTATKLGLHLNHPLFLAVPPDGEPVPDPVDSFSNVEQTFGPKSGAQLGPGAVILSDWEPGMKLEIAFETIETVEGQAPAQGVAGCQALATFIQKAQPKFQSHCIGCHGGGLQAAFLALDMSGLVAGPGGDVAAACGQIRSRVSLVEPEKSVIFMNTRPGGIEAHPFKFVQDLAAFTQFKSDVTAWILAEQ